MKKQLDSRWRQIDRFETSVRTLADAKLQWKKKMAGKEGEIDALKVRDSFSVSIRVREGSNDMVYVRSPTRSFRMHSPATVIKAPWTLWKSALSLPVLKQLNVDSQMSRTNWSLRKKRSPQWVRKLQLLIVSGKHG